MGDDETPELPNLTSMWQKDLVYTIGSIELIIEYLPGETRTKNKPGMRTVSNVFPVAYGRIQNTTDVHGEELDVYIKDAIAAENNNVYVIDQIIPEIRMFDEHKVMLGFSNREEIIALYDDIFSDGSGISRIGAITEFTWEQFTTWLDLPGATYYPTMTYTGEKIDSVRINPFAQRPGSDRKGNPVVSPSGAIVLSLPSLDDGPVIETISSKPGVFDHHIYIYSCLDFFKWGNAIDAFVDLLDDATDRDTAHIHLITPGGAVILMGRLISAMDRSKAHVITYAEGMVASAGTAIWASGHERRIEPGACFMQHMSSQGLVGKTTKIVMRAEFCKRYVEREFDKLRESGLFTFEEIDDMIFREVDKFISGREAIARVGAVSFSRTKE